MAEPNAAPEANPRHHVARLKQMLHDVATHARQDSGQISEAKAQALFETTAEVLFGLHKAFSDMAKKNESRLAVTVHGRTEGLYAYTKSCISA